MSNITKKSAIKNNSREINGTMRPSKGKKRCRKLSEVEEDALMRRLYPYTLIDYCYQTVMQEGDKNGKSR